jgi:hypothetical protein
MRRLAVLSLAMFAACIDTTHECDIDNGELRDRSLDVTETEYVDTSHAAWPATAVGGTQRFGVELQGCDDETPVDVSYARSENPESATVDVTSGAFDLRPVVPGRTLVDIGGGGVATSDSLSAAAIDHVALIAQESGEPGAFFVGAPVLVVELLDSTGGLLVDRNLTVATGGFRSGDKWDHLAIDNMPAGAYTLLVNAGNRPWLVDVTLVDHITDVTPDASDVAGFGSEPVDVCFTAHLDGVVVAGVPWQFAFDPHYGKLDPARANCVTVTDAAGNTRMVSAQALGFSASAIASFH